MKLFFFCIFTIFSFSSWSFEVPALKAPVNDYANFFSPSTEQTLNQWLYQLHQAGGSQIAILTVSSLEGESLEGASIAVADKWKLGSEKVDNGLLILISKKERKIRIEVGDGLEGLLTDAYSSRIIRNIITPEFKKSNYDQGILAAIGAITQKTDPSFKPLTASQKALKRVQKKKSGSGWVDLIVFIIFMIMVLSGNRSSLLALLFLSGGGIHPRSKGGYGGRGGFGGFSGGGGGFSGGGASGGW